MLSYLDPEVGPRIFLAIPEITNIEELETVPTLMKTSTERFFSHFFDNFKTINLVFKIPSEWARGGYENLMITVALTAEDINLDISRVYLGKIVEGFQKIPNAFKAFYLHSKSYVGELTIFEEIQQLLMQFYTDFPKEIVELKEYVTPINVGLIFAAWHESAGVDFLVAYPPEEFQNPRSMQFDVLQPVASYLDQ